MGKKAEKYTEKVGLTVSEVLEMIEETVEAAAAPKRKSRKKKEEELQSCSPQNENHNHKS